MAVVLGIDTSNYTTSCALYDTESGTVIQKKKLLPVKPGECGIRQSDAVFHHTQQLPVLMTELFSEYNGNVDAVCASSVPRLQEGSYMPCFTVGTSTSQSVAAAMNVPVYFTSHQQGHIMAALFSAQKLSLLSEKFIAFHVSGGTTEAILVIPDEENIFKCEIVGRTLDLNAGQLIDRAGVMMGLQFPCGKEIEKLASEYTDRVRVKPVVRGCDCCLSGFENKLRDIFAESNDKTKTSAYALAYVEATVSAMTESLFEVYGKLPVILAGGVMSNSIIRKSLESKFNCYFAEPEFSCDNASGTAIIGAMKFQIK